ncbi:MAG: endonuclease/exonuclease/phosphatase family protein [Prolixibacteraceae bacterium]
MKHILTLAFLCLFVHASQAQYINVMTYNIRLDLESDGINKWEKRQESVVELIKYYEPDIFGVQEAQHHQLNYLNNELEAYSYIGVGRDDGKTGGEYSAIFYNSAKYEVSHDSTIWLNENGEMGKLGWDAAYPRICTYGLFENTNTHHKTWVFNTHFDHIGNTAREESAKLILRTIKKVNSENLPVILTGDFNLTPESKPIQTIKAKMKDSYDVSKKTPYGPKGTFTGFDPNLVPENTIDYIFVTGFEVESIRHIDDKRADNFFVSDHLPIYCILKAYE